MNKNKVSVYVSRFGFICWRNGHLDFGFDDIQDLNTLIVMTKRLYAAGKSFSYHNKYDVATPIDVHADKIEDAIRVLKNLYFA